ncbi:MAG: hypothetical protein M1833_000842 [Piccolia ochrophora]|nr:MAG: hypothetical protein M1833_000842 [Piccolia ochrophora]
MDDSTLQNPKHVLLQRLLALTNRLRDSALPEGETLETLHGKVDDLEIAVESTVAGRTLLTEQSQCLIEDQSATIPSEISSPTTFPMSAQGTDVPIHSNISHDAGVRDEVLTRVTKAVLSLQQRNEEFKVYHYRSPLIAALTVQQHLHDIWIMKTERAAQRILSLESQAQEMETDLATDESELTYLKVQLKTLEVQAVNHRPEEEDAMLTEGIRRWKLDWADVDQRFYSRRKNRSSLSNETTEGTVR